MPDPLARLPALRRALQALHAGQFAAAATDSQPWAGDPEGGLIHALAQAASGDLGAAPALARIARSRPGHNHPVSDLLDLLRTHGRLRDGIPHLHAAMAECSEDPRLPALLGAVHAEIGPMPAAVAAFQAAAILRPDAAAWSNLGKALAAEHRFPEALQAFDSAIALDPTEPQFALNRAVALLKSGDLAAGWRAFECRHRLPGRPPPLPGPRLMAPSDAAGRTVLLQHEEGFGDTLQLLRYAALLAQAGGRVVAWVPRPLIRLAFSVPGVAEVVPPGAAPPFYDLWCPMLSLPLVFGTTLDRMPPAAPYLHAAGTPAPILRRDRLNIGVAWAGAARAADPGAAATDRVRSTTPAVLLPLAEVPGVRLVSLQWGLPAPTGMLEVMTGVQDFADTAGIVQHLDAVVSVDTAVAHLAAGMGKPVLLLDRYDNCWRWLAGRQDSPWYPTLRIYRQPRPGDWAPAVAAISQALANQDV